MRTYHDASLKGTFLSNYSRDAEWEIMVGKSQVEKRELEAKISDLGAEREKMGSEIEKLQRMLQESLLEAALSKEKLSHGTMNTSYDALSLQLRTALQNEQQYHADIGAKVAEINRLNVGHDNHRKSSLKSKINLQKSTQQEHCTRPWEELNKRPNRRSQGMFLKVCS